MTAEFALPHPVSQLKSITAHSLWIMGQMFKTYIKADLTGLSMNSTVKAFMVRKRQFEAAN